MDEADPPPVPPEAPLPTDCCGSGCPLCINDVYAAAMDLYEMQLAEWKTRRADATKSQ